LVASFETWGTVENSTIPVFENVRLKTHKCTEEELGLNEKLEHSSEHKFFEVDPGQKRDAKRLLGLWNCIDEE